MKSRFGQVLKNKKGGKGQLKDGSKNRGREEAAQMGKEIKTKRSRTEKKLSGHFLFLVRHRKQMWNIFEMKHLGGKLQINKIIIYLYKH